MSWCGSVYSTVVVTVNPLPASITGTTGVCLGATTTLYDAATAGVWSTGSTSIATVVAGTGLVSGAGLGTIAITYTLPSSCAASILITVSTLSTPITGTAIICGGATTILSETATGGTWSSSSPAIASINITSGLVTGGNVSAVSIATIAYNTAGGCSTSRIVTVNPQPAGITGASSVCPGATIALTSGPGDGSWSSSNTAIATVGSAGIVEGVASGTATVTYTSPAGCITSTTITVLPSPSSITGILSTCISVTTTLSDTVTGGYWTSSNTSVAIVDPLLGIVTGAAIGTATVSYTLGTGCTVAAIININNTPLPVSGTLTICPGSSTALSDTVTGGSWSGGVTAVATVDGSGNVYGVSAGTTIISYSIGTCAVSAVVTVNASPPAVSGVTEVCVGLATLMSNATSGGTWSSSSAAIASIVPTSGILTGGSAGTAIITYTLPDGCNATTIETVDTSPPMITGRAHVCPGSTSTLADGGGGSWSSGNTAVATIGATGIVGGVTVGTASIVYSIGAGCFIATTVTVNALPPAISGVAILCAGSTTTLSDGSGSWSPAIGGIATVDPATGVVTGLSGGTATITYTAATTGCTTHTNVTVNPLPLAIIGSLSLCPGTTVILGDRTIGGVWSSSSTGIASIGTAGIVTGLSPGTAVMSYTNAATGCATRTTLTINH